MEAGKRTINDLFNGNRTLKIPFFQRAYVWKQENWERFLDDMVYVSQSKLPYFFGSVILKQEHTDSSINMGDIRMLIDGQQRLTTLHIFFKVLYLKLNKNSSFERVFKLDSGKPALQHNYHDIEAFESILALTEEIELDANQNNLYALYEYFRKEIKAENFDEQSIKNNLIFVGIDLSKEDDEQQIFDSINSLGVRLTTAELLKNHFFRDKNDISDFDRYWRDIFDAEEKRAFWDLEVTSGKVARTLIDVFFHSFLQIKIKGGDLKINSADQIQFTKVDRVFSSYKDLINKYKLDKKELLKEIREYAEVFLRSFSFQVLDQPIFPNDYLARINLIIFGLGNAILIPYILYIQKNVEDLEQRKALFLVLESFMMRRVIVKASTMGLNNFFAANLIKNQIKTKEQFLKYINESEPYLHIPNDDELRNGFHTSHLVNGRAQVVLYLLESHMRNPKYQATQLLGFKKYTIEHLMPKKWETNWKFSGSDKEREIRNKKLLTLGNLTILPQKLNISISNVDWVTKKEGKGRAAGLNTHATGIVTLYKYLSLSEWNEEQIEKRADDLYYAALEVWKLN